MLENIGDRWIVHRLRTTETWTGIGWHTGNDQKTWMSFRSVMDSFTFDSFGVSIAWNCCLMSRGTRPLVAVAVVASLPLESDREERVDYSNRLFFVFSISMSLCEDGLGREKNGSSQTRSLTMIHSFSNDHDLTLITTSNLTFLSASSFSDELDQKKPSYKAIAILTFILCFPSEFFWQSPVFRLSVSWVVYTSDQPSDRTRPGIQWTAAFLRQGNSHWFDNCSPVRCDYSPSNSYLPRETYFPRHVKDRSIALELVRI